MLKQLKNFAYHLDVSTHVEIMAISFETTRVDATSP
jgi:hypothetical protein